MPRLAGAVTVLMVEDNPGDVELMLESQRVLDLPMDIHVVHDGEEALEYLAGRGDYADRVVPELILLDLNLPGLDGRDVLETVKTDLELRVIPVVVLTSSEAEDDVMDAYAKHANCYVRKPLHFTDYVSAVKSIHSFWLSTAILPRPA